MVDKIDNDDDFSYGAPGSESANEFEDSDAEDFAQEYAASQILMEDFNRKLFSLFTNLNSAQNATRSMPSGCNEKTWHKECELQGNFIEQCGALYNEMRKIYQENSAKQNQLNSATLDRCIKITTKTNDLFKMIMADRNKSYKTDQPVTKTQYLKQYEQGISDYKQLAYDLSIHATNDKKDFRFSPIAKFMFEIIHRAARLIDTKYKSNLATKFAEKVHGKDFASTYNVSVKAPPKSTLKTKILAKDNQTAIRNHTRLGKNKRG